MTQNRNNVIELFISNISNAIIHDILEKAIDSEEIATKYKKEIRNSFEIAKSYRIKINPVDYPLPEKDFLSIRDKIIKRVKKELNIRILKGYKNVSFELVGEIVDKYLRETMVFK